MAKKILVFFVIFLFVLGCKKIPDQNNSPLDINSTDNPPDTTLTKSITVSLKELSYSSDHMGIFRSSTNFRPMSENSAMLYFTLFPDHSTSRLTALSWSLRSSSCLRPTECDNSFITNLEKNDFLKNDIFRQKHQAVIFDIWGMPAWLSSSSSTQDLGGGVLEHQLYPPKNSEQWKEVVQAIADYYSQFDDLIIYFEIWNEPDLDNFWRADTEAYLRFYEETAQTLKAANPRFKVGGPTVNQWDGTVDEQSDPLIFELIRYTTEHQVPLDFISWHHYRYEDIGVAKTQMENVLRQSGMQPMPEFVVSEWHAPNKNSRNSEYAPAILANNYLGFYEAGIDTQTIYNWEDDHPENSPDQEYYGLLTRSGKLRPTFYVHQMFDNLSRDTLGISIIKETPTIVVAHSTKADCYKMIVWEWMQNPYTTVSDFILKSIPETELCSDYGYCNGKGPTDLVSASLIKGSSINGKRDTIFSQAKTLLAQEQQRLQEVSTYEFGFPGYTSFHLNDAYSAKKDKISKNINVKNNVISFPLEKNEVLFISGCFS